ncbi:MAG: MBL fold metallo-hydrolase [Bacteroidetes bacterium]|nr:MBL fold metallo-hydrolase [Bacteroidota bacterium]
MKKQNNIKIQFLGAVGTVTGSKYLIQTSEKNILIDCGLFQGLKKLRLLNWDKLPFNVSNIDLVLLTHGHLDHVGYLPKLVKDGFKGKIYGTEPTNEIAKIILQDSAKIQEEDAERANEKGYSKHKKAKPLYTLKDVDKTLPYFSSLPLNEWVKLSGSISFRYRYNSHIIGSTFIELKIGNKLFIFSGDIGRDDDLLMYPSEKPESADILFIESTYGNRIHPKNAEEKLSDIVNNSIKNGGTIIIPSFAVERTQMLMYMLWQLKLKKKIPNVPIYMDSPMGRNVLEIFHHHPDWHRLPLDKCNEMCKDIRKIETVQETLKIASSKETKIVIAGSGMASGGRVLTYFEKYIGDPKATILLVGYQAEGTRGRQLLEGVQEIKLLGKYFTVKAKVENIEGLSAHADQTGLINWMSHIKSKPKRVFVVHGEPQSADALRVKIKDVYGWNCEIPSLNEITEIN